MDSERLFLRKGLMWFLCRDQRQTTQCSVSHFALVGCKLIPSQSRWNLIWYSHMPERCQNKLRSVKNVRGKYFGSLRCPQRKVQLLSHCIHATKFRTMVITFLLNLTSKHLAPLNDFWWGSLPKWGWNTASQKRQSNAESFPHSLILWYCNTGICQSSRWYTVMCQLETLHSLLH